MTATIILQDVTVVSCEDMKYFEGSQSNVLKFTVAEKSSKKKEKEDKYYRPLYYVCEMWGKQATTLAPQIYQSSKENPCKVSIVGALDKDFWIDKTVKDDQGRDIERNKDVVRVNTITFPNWVFTDTEDDTVPAPTATAAKTVEEKDDLPF